MKRKGKWWLIGVFILSLCLVSPLIFAQEPKRIKTSTSSARGEEAVSWESMGLIEIQQGDVRKVVYVVQTGDTLWDIARRFLNSPYYWPKIWERNEFIINPHRIFPGDLLIIFPETIWRGYLPPPPTPTDGRPGISYQAMGSTGFISVEELEMAGEIVDSPQHKMLHGEGDNVYVDVGKTKNVVPGDKFAIFRVQIDPATGKPRQVKHPVTGELIGYKVLVLGALQLTKVEAKVSEGYIFNSYQEIERHDRILPYLRFEPEPVRVPFEETDVEMAKGYIIATKHEVTLIGRNDIVYVDLGLEQKVKKGNILFVYKPCEWVQDGASGEWVLVPHKIIGHLAVIQEPQKKTSVTLVVEATQELMIGERVLLSKFNQWEIEGISKAEDLARCRNNPQCRLITAEEYANGMESPFCERPKSPEEIKAEKKKRRADR